MPLVSIITPTYRRDPAIVARAIRSVRAQTFTDWEHIVCSDGEPDERPFDQLTGSAHRTHYRTSQVHHGDWGSGVRREMMHFATGKYLVFLDDDNLIFDLYLERMLSAIQKQVCRWAVCPILCLNRIPGAEGPPPHILPGVPVVGQIDTLSVMVEADLIRDIGWRGKGRTDDGETYAKLAEVCPAYARVDEVLGVHT